MNTPQKLSAKLTFDDVVEIKSLIWNGKSQSDTARLFRMSPPNINRIVHGYIWQEVPWPNGSRGGINITDHIRRLEELGIRRESGLTIPIEPTIPEPTTPPKTSPELPQKEEQTSEKEKPKPLTLEQKAAATDRIGELVEQAGTEMELAIAKSIKTSAKTARKGKDRPTKNAKDMTAKSIPWEQVQKKAPRNPMVLLAVVDEDLKKCICIAFRVLPEEMWNTPKAEEVVKQVGINLGIIIKGNFFKIKE